MTQEELKAFNEGAKAFKESVITGLESTYELSKTVKESEVFSAGIKFAMDTISKIKI